VAIAQLEDRPPFLNFEGVHVDLGDAGLLAGAMERLGHQDVADLIREKAALDAKEEVIDSEQ
jgi:hypothetical protein